MSQTDNALFLHRNLVNEPGVTVSASSEIADAEADMALTMDPGEPWRATGTTEEYIDFDFGTSVDATYGAFIHHNCDTRGEVQIKLSDNAPGDSDVFDSSALEPWDPVSGLGYDRFGSTLGGYPILSAYNDYRPLKPVSFGGVKSFRYARMYLRNPTNTGITGLALGRAFIGLGDQFEYNFAYDWENEWVDPSDQIETECSLRTKERRKYRVCTMSLPALRESEANSVWDDIKRTIGNSKSILVVPFPTADAVKRYRTNIYGIPLKTNGTRNPFFNVYAGSMKIRELTA